MNPNKNIPSVAITYEQTGLSKTVNEFGMRTMQARAYDKRTEQYLLIKSPPASGKSRALMFIALDKIHKQNLKQAIIVVPERSIGASFFNEPLSKWGFWADWVVKPQWDLCSVPAIDNEKVAKSKVATVQHFFESQDTVLVCTHATFRFAVERFGVEAFDDRLIGVDEFHHLSTDSDNVLGSQFKDFIQRGKIHIVAMTGSYFRGDAVPVLSPDDEAKFSTVTYTYYEQLNGYDYLKALDIGYKFYCGSYLDSIGQVLDSDLKTIVHIPNVNSRESTQRGKSIEVSEIIHSLGDWVQKDPETGFDLVRTPDGRLLKIADLVDDGPDRHTKVLTSLRNPKYKNTREHIDIIIALGMAKEGFDWLWCEHALTIGYRSSLTEIVQIIGRATRDAPGKERVKFTNLIAEPDATEEKVIEAVNDTLKAIAASLLMEQVLVPKLSFVPVGNGAKEDFDYGEAGYQQDKPNIGIKKDTGEVQIELNGLVGTETEEASRIIEKDLNEIFAETLQNKEVLEKGLFDNNIPPQEITQVLIGKVVRDRYPHLSSVDQEAIRQRAVATFNINQLGRTGKAENAETAKQNTNTSFVENIRRFSIDIRELDIDLIDSINPFGNAYEIMAKTMNEDVLSQVTAVVSAKRAKMDEDEAKALAIRAKQFLDQRGRLPQITSADLFEKRMAEAIEFLKRKVREEQND